MAGVSQTRTKLLQMLPAPRRYKKFLCQIVHSINFDHDGHVVMDDVPDYKSVHVKIGTSQNTESPLPGASDTTCVAIEATGRTNITEMYLISAYTLRRSLSLFGESKTMNVLKKDLKPSLDPYISLNGKFELQLSVFFNVSIELLVTKT